MANPMRYHPAAQINMIVRLQEDAAKLHKQIALKLAEADELAAELVGAHGKHFVCEGQAFKFQHGGIGFGIVGNRDWLRPDFDVKVIRT